MNEHQLRVYHGKGVNDLFGILASTGGVFPQAAPLLRRLLAGLHVSLQHRVNPGLVSRPFGLEKLQYFGIDPYGNRLLRLGQLDKGAFEEGVIKPGDIGGIDIPILQRVNPFQVALDRFSFHVRSPFSSKGDRLPLENPMGIFEAQAVLFQVLPVFLPVPLELHAPSIHTIRMYVKKIATVSDCLDKKWRALEDSNLWPLDS